MGKSRTCGWGRKVDRRDDQNRRGSPGNYIFLSVLEASVAGFLDFLVFFIFLVVLVESAGAIVLS